VKTLSYWEVIRPHLIEAARRKGAREEFFRERYISSGYPAHRHFLYNEYPKNFIKEKSYNYTKSEKCNE
jgi:hypothetical protein